MWEMPRLGPIAFALLLVSCAAAQPTIPAPQTPLSTAIAAPSPAMTARPAALLGQAIGSAQADFDCDAKMDRLQFFEQMAATPDDANRLAQLTLATGAVHQLALAATVESSPLLGIADVNGDGCDDAIVTLDRGASTTWTTFLVYDGTALRRVVENGRPAMFLFGGSVRHGNAIECRRTKDAAEIVIRGASDYTSDYQWDAVEDVHRWSSSSQLVLWSTSRSVIAVGLRYALPPDADRYWGLSCGNVTR
jgi:hypothetical protein